MDACDLLDAIAAEPGFGSRLTFRAEMPARAARHGDLTTPLHPELRARLAARGIDELYAHQAEAITALGAGEDVVVATGTASGKSLCYQLPIIDAVLRGEPATALLLFPTKALAHDQLRSIRSWLVPGLRAVTYDGDSPPDDRAWARRHANVVLTNPEMLHQGILPFHGRWATFLMRLRYVVVDELHALRGIFGSHVANVLRRLRRVCAHHRNDPRVCCSSATIGNPAELAGALWGSPVRAITDDGSPAPPRCLAVWQRPFVDEALGVRASAVNETADLLGRFVRGGHPTLAFTRSRRGSELIAARSRRDLQRVAPELAGRVAAYRAGYLPEERRAIERGLSEGSIVGVAATNALELGIDVGGLDAVIANGFPGTLASLRQQIGRAGRADRRAAAVLVVGDDQLDQWYGRHPEALMTRPSEAAVVNPDNPYVRTPHVGCAAHELPLEPADERWFGPRIDDSVRELLGRDRLRARGGRFSWAGRHPPARAIGLRSGSSVEIELRDAGDELVGTVDAGRALHVAHPGAIYLHQGRQWRVEELDLGAHVARLVPADDVDEHTQPREDTDISVTTLDDVAEAGAGRAHLGEVEVTTRVIAYQRVRTSTREALGVRPLDLPPITLHTRAFWYSIAAEDLVRASVPAHRVLGAVHAAEHTLIGLLPLFTICDRWDVGGVSMAFHPSTGTPTIFVYDGYDGGAGIADLAFADRTAHLEAALDTLLGCRCADGCPSCVQSPKCGNLNEHLDKEAAARLVGLLSRPRSPGRSVGG